MPEESLISSVSTTRHEGIRRQGNLIISATLDGGDGAADFAHHAAGLILPRVHRFAGKLDAVGDGFFEFMVIGRKLFDQLVDDIGSALGGTRAVSTQFGKLFLRLATRFPHLGEEDATVRHAAEAIDETELGERPDCPLARIPLPWLHAVAVVVLELVVIVVIAFAEGEEGHDGAVPRTVAGGVWLATKHVAEGVDEKRAMLGDHDAADAGDKESTECAGPWVHSHLKIPKVAECHRNDDPDDEADPVHILVLPHDQFVFPEVGDIVHRWLRIELEKQPTDVRPEEALGDIIGIFVMVDVFVMEAVIGRPVEAGIFERTGAEDEGEEFYGHFCLKRQMGKQSVITDGDTHHRGCQVKEEHGELKPVDADFYQVDGDPNEGHEGGANKE